MSGSAAPINFVENDGHAVDFGGAGRVSPRQRAAAWIGVFNTLHCRSANAPRGTCNKLVNRVNAIYRAHPNDFRDLNNDAGFTAVMEALPGIGDVMAVVECGQDPGVVVCALAVPGVGRIGRLGKDARIVAKAIRRTESGTELDKSVSKRVRQLQRLAQAGHAVRGVRNFDVPNPEAAARATVKSLTRGPGVHRLPVKKPGVTIYELPEGGRVVLRSPAASRSGLWAVDVHGVNGVTIRSHYR